MIIARNFISIFLLFIFQINFSWCQNIFKLSTNEFNLKIQDDKTPQIIDVRTPEEFIDGFIANALNINLNGNSFDSEVAKFNKLKPVYVYCLAGGRSANAAIKLKELGFTIIYELKGGMNAWRNASMPIQVSENVKLVKNSSLSIEDFNKILNENILVLVDVFAPWCGPCIKMAPYLDEIAVERKSNLTFLKINNDDNQQIVKYLFVDELPTIILYKNGKRIYTNIGLITKADLLKVIDENYFFFTL
ncbi:MAG: thioredoxin [Bacteroidia bacterium]|nr:thioredoxin [Bacteroidia bacterium]